MKQSVKLLSADPLTKGHVVSWDTFAQHGLVFSGKHPVIRGHLLNVDRQIMKFFIRYLAYSLQTANTHSRLIFTLIVQILLTSRRTCHAVQHELQRRNWKQCMSTNLFFNTGECSPINNIDLCLPIIFSIHLVFLTSCYHFMRKIASKRKNFTLEQRVQVTKALDSGCSYREVALKFWVWKITKPQDQDFYC